MRYKIYFSVLMIFSFTFLSIAQDSLIIKNEIKWTGIKTLKTDTITKKVISFQDAVYPNDNELPYFWYRFDSNTNTNYNLEVTNTEFISITDKESQFIDNNEIPETLRISIYYSYAEGQSYKNIEIFPFIKKDTGIYKLKSFDLIRKKSLSPAKSPNKENTRHSYAQNSVLNSGKFVKVKVAETGVYKITYEALKSMGINPENVRVFGYGGALLEQDFTLPKPDDLPEVAIWIEKGSDGLFNSGDYILFYGQGIIKWKYDQSKEMFIHTLNHYSNEGYYFITSDVGTGKKIEEKTIDVPDGIQTSTINNFTDYYVHEKEIRNIGKTGKVFYGEVFYNTTQYNIPIPINNIESKSNLKIRIDAAAISNQNSQFTVTLNDSESKFFNIRKKSSDYSEIGKDANTILNYTTKSSQIKLDLKYNNPDISSKGYLNYIEVNAIKKLEMQGDVMPFRSIKNLGSSVFNKYVISNTNNDTQIWDITDPSNIKRIKVNRNGNVIDFTDSNVTLKQYIAINPKAKNSFILEPTVVGEVPNQNLHSLEQIDYMIITHPDFISQAERLAQVHRDKNKLRVGVVTTEQVYNEFSSGTPDASAYRWLMKMLYDRALTSGNKEDLPKYLLLFGRGSYDNRGIIPNSGDNLILTYQADLSLHKIKSYVTDDYFGYLDDSEGVRITSDLVDIGIGRFPVANQVQADIVIDKTIAYINNEIKGKWKNQLAFVADDGDGGLHVRQSDSIASLIGRINRGYQINKIYLDAYKQEVSASGERYPMVYSKIQNLISSGLLMLNFTGHASENGWTSEGVLKIEDIKNMYNKKLPLWTAATCDFILFDVQTVSAGEYVLITPNGGGVGLFSAARTVYSSENERINRYFTKELFSKRNKEYPRIGDAIKNAKRGIGAQINKLSYVYFGDPAIKLNYPDEYQVITTEINNNPVTSSAVDTLRAISKQKITGYIANQDGVKTNDFNGTLEVTVYDKEQTITTLNNDKDGSYRFVDRPNIIYTGKVNVINGVFNVEFVVPKDIKYNYGKGRINYYASDSKDNKEAQGYYENFIIGGSNPEATYETEGPSINMYLNTTEFESEDKVNETPLFVAHISDETGINTVGSGIGHDLRLIIDDNPQTSYTLNEYFSADTNNYRAGVVRFKIPKMIEGKHTLKFVAWDLLNNSTTTTFDFEVVNGLTPVITSVVNYPNPASSHTTFLIEHDRPEVVLEAKLDVFDTTGRLIMSQKINNADKFSWDLKDTAGYKIAPGIYLYRVSIKTINSEFTTKTNKIIVLKE